MRLYKAKAGTGSGVLVLKAHGGGKLVLPSHLAGPTSILICPSVGWVIGSHEIEDAENRMMAAHANAVVVRVDYRMAPEFSNQFPETTSGSAGSKLCGLPQEREPAALIRRILLT